MKKQNTKPKTKQNTKKKTDRRALIATVAALGAISLIVFVVFCLVFRANKTDYSLVENWYKCDYLGNKEVDTFFIYPTLIEKGDSQTTIAENREAILNSSVYESQMTVYTDSTNLYAPLYRQLTLEQAATSGNNEELVELLRSEIDYQDIVDALDYYFENFNNGKPFILAGHSQGSAMMYNILTDYMEKHPDYYSRMVAAYAIGYGYSKSGIAKYPHLKFATGADDTGVIVSYNTYGPEQEGESILLAEDSFVINPLNWATDETYASFAENKGSLYKGEAVAGLSDAQIDLERGILVTNADEKYETQMELFSTHSFHLFDYGFYYNNLKENVQTRIDAFLNK